MARDRKRAKQRRQRSVRGEKKASAAPSSGPVRADLPGALDHASSDVDEFDAALVRGAGGTPVEPGIVAPPPAAQDGEELEPDGSGLLPPDDGGPSGGGGDSAGGSDGGDRGGQAAARGPAQPTGNRVVAFLRASWAELQRVQWPDRRQVTQATAVVLGFVAVAGAYLGLADWAAQKIVNFIL